MDKNLLLTVKQFIHLAMSVSDRKILEAVALFKEQGGIMRILEALDEGIYSRTLYWMRDHGYLTQLERGVYRLENKEPLSKPGLAIVGTKVPTAGICLISALDFYI